MKNFNGEQFKATLKETPWDSVFIFDDIDDMLSSWELLFNTALEELSLAGQKSRKGQKTALAE